MKWNKMGMIIQANGQREWMSSHIQNPVAVEMQEWIRVYFTTRPKPVDGFYKSVTAYLDLDKKDLSRVINICEDPILECGSAGAFDEDGIMPGAILKRGDEYWLYYMGWRRTITVPYVWTIGLAISKDGGESYKKYSEGPIIGIDCNDPFLCVAPRSVFERDGIIHMYYSSGLGWLNDGEKMESMYRIKHATSRDGIHWKKEKKYCIETVYEDESQGAGCIYEEKDFMHMWFTYRHSYNFRNAERGYLIGHSYSKDLKKWIRDDELVGIGISESGWDSEMICYPYVIRIDERVIMFYCGNGFGSGGLGYAELIDH